MEFSKPFKSYGFKNFGKEDYKGFWRKFDQTKNFPEMAGKQIRAYFDFDAAANEKVKIKFAISPVSTEGAISNLRSEIPHWDFERTKREAQAEWNKELNKVAVTTLDQGEMVNFYTALYHALLTPTVYMDTNGRYKGIDQNIHQAGQRPARERGRNTQGGDHALANAQASAFTNYTTFSLWDTYRALHPLLNIIQPARNRDMIRSMLAHYDQSVHKMLPVWSHYANENWCMIGYHSVSVIADAIVKGNFTGPEAMKALEASAQTARTKYYDGLEYYMKLGYVPEDKNSSSVSKTLEYAYDDWCIAQAAKKLNRTDLYREFIKRSENWRNVYDSSTGFMRPKISDGKFREKFDVLSTHDQGFHRRKRLELQPLCPARSGRDDQADGRQGKILRSYGRAFYNAPARRILCRNRGHYARGNHRQLRPRQRTRPPRRISLQLDRRPVEDAGTRADDPEEPIPPHSRRTRRQRRLRPDVGVVSVLGSWILSGRSGIGPICTGKLRSSKLRYLDWKTAKRFRSRLSGQSEKSVYVKRVVVNGSTMKGNSITHAQIMNGGKIVFHMADTPGK